VKGRILAAVLVALSPSAALGEEVCGQIVQSAIYNQMRSVGVTKQFDVNKANFCVIEYDKASEGQQAQIKASYGAYRGKGGWSSSEIRDRQRIECEDKYGEHWYMAAGLMEHKQVSDRALATVDSCIKALTRGLKVEPVLTETEDAIQVTMTWGGGNEIAFRSVRPVPSSNASCTFGPKKANEEGVFNNVILKPNQPVMFECERTVTEKTDDSGEKVECFEPVLIGIDTGEGAVSLNLSRRCNKDFLLSRAQQVEQKLASGLAAAKDEAATLESRLSALEELAVQSFFLSDAIAGIGTAVAKCPEGSHVVSGNCYLLGGEDRLQNMGAASDSTWECTYALPGSKVRAQAYCAKAE
jgi:hypothetical protein